MRKKLIIF